MSFRSPTPGHHAKQNHWTRDAPFCLASHNQKDKVIKLPREIRLLVNGTGNRSAAIRLPTERDPALKKGLYLRIVVFSSRDFASVLNSIERSRAATSINFSRASLLSICDNFQSATRIARFTGRLDSES